MTLRLSAGDGAPIGTGCAQFNTSRKFQQFMGSAFSGRSLAPPPGSVNLPMRPCRFHDGGNGVAGQKVTASGSDTEHVTSANRMMPLNGDAPMALKPTGTRPAVWRRRNGSARTAPASRH